MIVFDPDFNLKCEPIKQHNENTVEGRRLQKISESRTSGWWDGPERYQFVNRNIVSTCQRDSLFLITQSLCKHLGMGIGIGGSPIEGVVRVNVGDDSDVKVTDYHLPFEDNSIGYIISSHTLEHIPEPPNIVIDEWLRVLKPNGLIAITMPDKRFHLHENKEGISKYDFAYNEMEPSELFSYLKKLTYKVKLLRFDENKNNFDFDALLLKEGN